MNLIFKTLRAALLGLALGGLMLAAGQSEDSKGKRESAKTQQTDQAAKADLINVNTADLETLMKLPRVGPVIGQRIIDFREEHGGFKSLEEVMNVKGIGEKTFERLKPLIRI